MLFPFKKQSTNPPRVVITGAGIITALGHGWTINAAGFRAGKTAFRPVTLFDVSKQRAKNAAEITLPTRFPKTLLSERHLNRIERAGKFLLLAAHEAWQQSGWESSDQLPIVLGTTSGGMSLGEDYFRQAIRPSNSLRNQAVRVAHYQAQRQAQDLADAFGFSGPITIIANACASGANAIGHAWEMIRSGKFDRVLTGGYDGLSHLVFSGFDSLQALSTTQTRPFDAQRDGLALGEGAAVLTLETLESAQKRGATILGEIVGYGAATDCHHLTQPHPQGDAALASMNAAAKVANVNPEQINYINAHGTGTPLNDSAEAMAINRFAGEHAKNLPVSSTKASIGHTLGAAGAIEAVICLMTLREQWLPPSLSFQTPDPACGFPVIQKPTDAKVEFALTNSFGFGGANATLILQRWDEGAEKKTSEGAGENQPDQSKNIYVQGVGAVSPAGWGMDSFRGALEKNIPAAHKDLTRVGSGKPLHVRQVPPPPSRPAFLAHARLRRTSPITQYAVAAGIEALGDDAAAVSKGELKLGIVLCVMSGCVNYSRRFYDEALRDPATASPLVFPETVFNAPASHIAALLGTNAINYTIVGDPGTFLQGLALAADWLSNGRVDGCLVIGAEEIDWLTASAFQLFQKQMMLSDGAGAIYLRGGSGSPGKIKLKAITDSNLFLKKQSRSCAIQKMRGEMPNSSASETILCDSTQQISRLDADEMNAWKDWNGRRVSVKNILGEGLMAASAWQCVAAIDALKQSDLEIANVSVVGANQHAIGAQFIK